VSPGTLFIPLSSQQFLEASAKKARQLQKKAKQSKQSVLAPGTVATNAPAAVTPVANPASPPGSDPLVEVAGREVTRSEAVQRLLGSGGSGNDSTLPTAIMIGAVALLPIVGALALGGFGKVKRLFRGSAGP
jgi:hypothetical protein